MKEKITLLFLFTVVPVIIAFSQFKPQWAFNPADSGLTASAQTGKVIKTDNAGNTYVAGEFRDTVDFDPGTGYYTLKSAGILNDIFLAKYSTTGNLVWAKSIGSTDNDYCNYMAIDSDGNVYITGYFTGTVDFNPGGAEPAILTANTTDIYFAKYNTDGNYVYAKAVGGPYGMDVSNSIFVDAAKNVYLTGYFYRKAQFDPENIADSISAYSETNYDIFYAKYSASGNYVYAKSISCSGFDEGKSIAADTEGNVYLTGYFNGTADFDPGTGVVEFISSGNDILMAKYDLSGNYLWAKKIGAGLTDQGLSLALDASNNIYLTGIFNGTVDFNPGGTEPANLVSAGGNDIFISKYDQGGNYISTGRMGGSGADRANSIAMDALGNIYITGNFNGTADFDPGSGTANLVSNGSSDIYLAKYDNTINYVSAVKIGGTGSEEGFSVNIDKDQNALLTGKFRGTVDFDPGTNTLNLQSRSGTDDDIFIVKYNQTPEIEVKGNSISIANGDNTPTTTDHTEFGSTGIGSTLQRTFEIRNSGGATLNLTGSPRVAVSGTGFSLAVDAPSTIAVGQTVTFTISFTPATIETLTGSISIANNDEDENPFTFAIAGTGTKIPQTITGFTISSPKIYGDAPFTISATGGGSGNPVIFSSSDITIATCTGTNGSTITLLKPGTVKIFANQAGNDTYSDAPQVEQSIVINTKVLTVTGITANNKVYNGTTFGTITGTAALEGVVGTDDVILVTGTISPLFNNKNIGVGKPVTVYGYSISGNDATKYTFPNPVLYADITPILLTISGLVAENKEYDATTAAIVNGTAQLNGVLGAEVVSLFIENASADFNYKNVGINKQVFLSGYSLDGNDKANYTLDLNSGLMADITPKALLVTGIVAENKEYDGTTSAFFSGGTLDGVIGEDQVAIASITGEFASANAGTDIEVTVTSITLGGSDGGNYTVSYLPTGLTADILKATPIITWENPANITSGTALSSTQLNATASVEGTFEYTPPSGTILNVGNNQELKTDFTPTDGLNYNTASKTVYINVVTTTGIERISEELIILYPNPVVDKITLSGISEFATAKKVKLQIIDHLGKLVFSLEKEYLSDIEHIEVENLIKGTYYLCIQTENHILVKRFIKL